MIFPTVLKRFARDGLYEMHAPLEVTTAYLRELQNYWALRTRSKTELIAAYRDLGGVVSKYAHAAEENAELRRAVERLERLLRLSSFDHYRSESARVVNRDFNGWWQQLTIRKGSNFTIPVGAPVIFTGGVVGRVTEVHTTTAIVDLISSPKVRLAASFEGDDRPVSFQGGINPPLSRPTAIAEFVPLDLYASAADPKPLITSGLGGVFPRGLRVGTVVKLDPSPDGLFKTGRVALDPRLNQITEVTVLVPLDPL
ncbi:MAG: rod shape-determining protein MreC [Candidatus Synoicihabitans palmerolidicus]|nr:rod shape-determining protein MreC [Candidatus Synoicihabitans palmerolidicus]